LVDLIKPFKLIPHSKFNQIYRNYIRPHYVTRNEVIYTEGTAARNFYIIYEGQFRLKKNNIQAKKDSYQKFYKSDVAKHNVVMNLTTGDFAGFEAFMNYDHSLNLRDDIHSQLNSENETFNEKFHTIQDNQEKISYKNSLVAECEFNVVFSINPNVLSKELRNYLYEFFRPIFAKKENFISQISCNHQVIKEKMKLTYRENIIKNISKDNNKILFDKIDKLGVDDNYLKIVHPQHLEKTKTQNKFQNLKTSLSSFRCENKKKNANNYHDFHNPKISKFDFKSEDEKFIPDKNFDLKTITSYKTENSSTSTNDYTYKESSPNRKINLMKCPFKSQLDSRNTKRLTIHLNSIDKSVFLKEKSINLNDNRFNTITSLNKKDSMSKDKNSIHRDSSNYSRDHLKRLKLKILKNDKEKPLIQKGDNLGQYVHKFVAKTINDWNKVNKDSSMQFSTGEFNLPLFTRMNTISVDNQE